MVHLLENKTFAYAYTDLLYKKSAKNAMKKASVYVKFCRFVNEVLQIRERKKDVFRRAPI